MKNPEVEKIKMPFVPDSVWLLGHVFYELALFSAIGYLIIGVDEIAIDLIWLGTCVLQRIHGDRRNPHRSVDRLPQKTNPEWFAVFIPARDESAVIGQMLDGAFRSYLEQRVHIFVGCYPDDPRTIEIARRYEGEKLSVVVLKHSDPSTKAECLNELYLTIKEHECRFGRKFAGFVLHDAEDVIHRHEIDVFDAFVDRYGMIQLPVVPLQDENSRWISGHYCDEFAEAHAKRMIVRQVLGAALPSAGVGCMIRRDAVEALAELGKGRPFAEDSVTEDYEVGLRIVDLGFNSAFLRIAAPGDYGIVATTAHFPASLKDSIRQKTRWVAGISLAAWDRIGWGRGWIEKWMRMRDRASLVSAVVSMSGYIAALLGGILFIDHAVQQWRPDPFDKSILTMVEINGLILIWRLCFRFLFVARLYGRSEGRWSVPRIAVSSVVAILSAWFALSVYLEERYTGKVKWAKTAHKYPSPNISE